jgi:hypothetical protein
MVSYSRMLRGMPLAVHRASDDNQSECSEVMRMEGGRAESDYSPSENLTPIR